MQFAISRLGFTPNQIILHGWSIGGFSASWIAMNYPDIKAVVRTINNAIRALVAGKC